MVNNYQSSSFMVSAFLSVVLPAVGNGSPCYIVNIVKALFDKADVAHPKKTSTDIVPSATVNHPKAHYRPAKLCIVPAAEMFVRPSVCLPICLSACLHLFSVHCVAVVVAVSDAVLSVRPQASPTTRPAMRLSTSLARLLCQCPCRRRCL